MSVTDCNFSANSLYLVAFAQARAPHAGLIIPKDELTGTLVHIRIDHTISPNWTMQVRPQRITNEMSMTSLLRLRAASKGVPTVEQAKEAAYGVGVPDNDKFGECVPWIFGVVFRLHEWAHCASRILRDFKASSRSLRQGTGSLPAAKNSPMSLLQ